MERNCEEKEIKEALDSLTSEKAPVLEGLPMEIYNWYKHFMKPEIMAIVYELLENCFLNWRVYNTFVALVTIKEGEKEVTDFPSISLLHGVYKIIAKALATRMRNVMLKLVSYYQTTTVKGRQMHDSISVANELADNRVDRRNRG